jgi:HD superfamily phosphohydrolase
MLNVADDELAVERKGIYSIEKFLVARRLMYWQVYLHKTVLSAEFLLTKILSRAKELAAQDDELFASDALAEFLYHQISKEDFLREPDLLRKFSLLDDYDIMGAIKVWSSHSDHILSQLCDRLVNRKLFKIQLQNEPFSEETIQKKHDEVKNMLGLNENEVQYFVFSSEVSNSAYSESTDGIKILYKDGSLRELQDDADLINISALSKPVRKYFMCYPKSI